jgi:hypothetical protein
MDALNCTVENQNMFWRETDAHPEESNKKWSARGDPPSLFEGKSHVREETVQPFPRGHLSLNHAEWIESI